MSQSTSDCFDIKTKEKEEVEKVKLAITRRTPRQKKFAEEHPTIIKLQEELLLIKQRQAEQEKQSKQDVKEVKEVKEIKENQSKPAPVPTSSTIKASRDGVWF